MNKKFKKLLNNYADESSSLKEQEVVDLLFDKFQENGITKEDIEANKKLKAKILKSILAKTSKNKLSRFNWKYVAAAIIVFLGLTFVYKNEVYKQKPGLKNLPVAVEIDSNNNIEPGTSKAVLTLQDGAKIALTKGKVYQSSNASSTGENLVYYKNSDQSKNIQYNYLAVPRGAEFALTLSDGTKVVLNSETKIKYPVAFTKGKTRQVELLYGEAYFDVSPSTNHKGAKFKVLNVAQEIEVLGTKFNVKAYQGDNKIETTLIEGKVAVLFENTLKYLAPNQQSNLNILNKKVKVNTVNVEEVTSWLRGEFTFKGTPLKEIMKMISRWYDVDVIFKEKALENVTFKGVLTKNQNLEKILETIKNLSIIKTYEIHDKTIVLE